MKYRSPLINRRTDLCREGLCEKHSVRQANAAPAAYVQARSQRGDSHIPAIEVFAALKDGNRLREWGMQHPGSFAGQCRAIFHSELRQQRRDVKFHGSYGDIQLGRNLLVGAVMNHGLQDFSLPGAERGRMGYGTAFREKLLGAGQHMAGDGIFSGNENHEIVRIVSAREALHGK